MMKKTSEVYKKLYHYTDYHGLDGIIKSQSLWAKNYKSLNDEKEILLFLEERLPQFLYPHIQDIYTKRIFEEPFIRDYFFKSGETIESLTKHDADVMIPCMLNPLNDQIYICSFSGKSVNENINRHGQLSQWRAYGKDGGYCIILDTQKIEDLMLKDHKKSQFSHMGLGDVVYSDDEAKYKEEFDEYLKEIIFLASEIAENIGKKSLKASSDRDPFTAFVSCITRYKHFGFKEENEVRLVCIPDLEEASEKTFIKNTIRYVDVFKNLTDKLPIEAIIVGPHKDKFKRAKALKDRLKSTDIEVLISDIPYVGNKN